MKSVAPVASGSYQVSADSSNTNVTVTGTTVDYPAIRSVTLQTGSWFSEEQARNAARVAVLGPTTAETLFGSVDAALGQQMRITGAAVQGHRRDHVEGRQRLHEHRRCRLHPLHDVRSAPLQRRWSEHALRRGFVAGGDDAGRGRHLGAAAEPARDRRRGQGRLSDHEPGRPRLDARHGHHPHDGVARLHRRDLAARRGHRNHEHDAHHRDRADSRDRAAGRRLAPLARTSRRSSSPSRSR